jgi:hypothetical protein
MVLSHIGSVCFKTSNVTGLPEMPPSLTPEVRRVAVWRSAPQFASVSRQPVHLFGVRHKWRLTPLCMCIHPACTPSPGTRATHCGWTWAPWCTAFTVPAHCC